VKQKELQSIARIFSIDGSVVGGGILISDRHILTSTHVVASAIDLSGTIGQTPKGQIIDIDFPQSNQRTKISARVHFWPAVEQDVAVLELVTRSVGSPAHLQLASNPWKHTYRVFGFPRFAEKGRWSSGEMLDKDGRGYIQLQSTIVPGQRIDRGFGGAPVWDEQVEAFVGIVAEVVNDPQMKTAYMIPTETLLTVWPELQQYLAPSPGPVDIGKPAIAEPRSDVNQTWKVGKLVAVGDCTYVVYEYTENPADAANRTSVSRLAKVKIAQSAKNPLQSDYYWLKQEAFRRDMIPREQQRRIQQQIKDEAQLLQQLNREKYFPRFIDLDQSQIESTILIFTANKGKTLAEANGFVFASNKVGFEGKLLRGQRARQLLEGVTTLCTMLDTLHHKGYAHRNLTPESMLYSSDRAGTSRLVLRDLGLATYPKEAREGHPDYAAPEQRRALDFKKIGPATDIYQLGAVLYHLLCGRSPNRTTWDIEDPTVYNPDLPLDIDAVLQQALHEDPTQRWSCIEKFGSALFDVAQKIR
jgi:serine/threonine protein kinase